MELTLDVTFTISSTSELSLAGSLDVPLLYSLGIHIDNSDSCYLLLGIYYIKPHDTHISFWHHEPTHLSLEKTTKKLGPRKRIILHFEWPMRRF